MRSDLLRTFLLVLAGTGAGIALALVVSSTYAARTDAPLAMPPLALSGGDASTTPPEERAVRPNTPPPGPSAPIPAPARSASPFVYSFNVPGTLEEAPNMSRSTSPYWFLDSGGELLVSDSQGSTMQGAAPPGSKWQQEYERTSSADTGNGRYPQNLFRLVTKETFANPSMQASFLIEQDNLVDSPNRNESNGLLLMSRYQNGATLYYAGIRVDGTAIIKKKYRGTYYTMSQTPVFPGTYDRAREPNLLPHATWLTLRMDTRTLPSGSVEIRLLMSKDGGITWDTVATASDDGSYGGTPPLTAPGLAGIRTDFMDVGFRNIRISELGG